MLYTICVSAERTADLQMTCGICYIMAKERNLALLLWEIALTRQHLEIACEMDL
ncbi:MAG: hypothetical protein V7L00_00715 [Nostoc sp.]|uniref:hypothetical protein n=1 Tax=Nostoc sp. TaxID=1180 RepID=UPI002FFBE583